MDWIMNHPQSIIIVIAIYLVVGLVITLAQNLPRKNELVQIYFSWKNFFRWWLIGPIYGLGVIINELIIEPISKKIQRQLNRRNAFFLHQPR